MPKFIENVACGATHDGTKINILTFMRVVQFSDSL